MISPVEWIEVAGSTLVAAIAYDDAAERIYVRLHSGDAFYFEDCDVTLWRQFQSPAISKGQFIESVLEHHAYRRVPGPCDK
jgi:hypothetical protein